MSHYQYRPPGSLDITIYRGVDTPIALSWSPGGVPGDLTGYSVRFELLENTQGSILLTVAADITDPTHGIFSATFTAEQVATITIPKIHWRLKFIPPSEPAYYLFNGTVSLVYP